MCITMSRIPNIRRKDSCRWSDPIVRRRKATGSGDSDSSATSYSGSVLSPSSKNPPPPPSQPPSRGLQQESSSLVGCWCHHKCQVSHRDDLLMPKHSRNRHELSKAHTVQRLSMKISEYKGRDLEEMARYNALKNLFHRIRSALDFVVHYARCLELQHNTNLHLHRLVSSVVTTPTDHLVDLLNASSSEHIDATILRDVMEQAVSGLEECSRIKGLKQDFKMKASDLLLATNNFNLLLTNLKVMSSQLRKIESQYDDIFLTYRQSRTALEREMTKIINNLKEALSVCFKGISRWLEHMGKNYSQLVELFSCLEEELKSPPPTEPPTPTQHSVGTVTDPVTSCGDIGGTCTCLSCPEHNNASSQSRPR